MAGCCDTIGIYYTIAWVLHDGMRVRFCQKNVLLFFLCFFLHNNKQNTIHTTTQFSPFCFNYIYFLRSHISKHMFSQFDKSLERCDDLGGQLATNGYAVVDNLFDEELLASLR
jgi:hypothetical protein